MANINWDYEKSIVDKEYKKKGPPPIVAGGELPFVIYVTLHERIYWTAEAGHLQCSRPMINCSVQHLGDHKRSFTITNDLISQASSEIDKKLSADVQSSLTTKIPGVGGAEVKADLSSVTGFKEKISEELKRHVGEKPEFELKSHAPPCYEIIAPFGAYVVISIDGDAKITRYFTWDANKGEIAWTDKIEVEPSPPFGFKVGMGVAFGLFEWVEGYARKVRPCDCHGEDMYENPPTAEEMHLEDAAHAQDEKEKQHEPKKSPRTEFPRPGPSGE